MTQWLVICPVFEAVSFILKVKVDFQCVGGVITNRFYALFVYLYFKIVISLILQSYMYNTGTVFVNKMV